MKRAVLFMAIWGGTLLLFCASGSADIPAPPVNQSIGLADVTIANMTATQCRVCHTNGVQDEHHLLYGKTIPSGITVPFPDANGDGKNDTTFSCITCHGPNFSVEPNCVICHASGNPHHESSNATSGNCKACHGSIVDNMNDGHYIPTYKPSLVTPTPRAGDGLPQNSRKKGAGACDYCHDTDGLATPVIQNNKTLHHGTKLSTCSWCHDTTTSTIDTSSPAQMRACEKCHGPKSLHNIQADSPAAGNVGKIVVGGEDAGYGHVGKDAGPADSDCWGCHGFAVASAPDTGPIVPTLYKADRTSITTGVKTSLVLTGSAFINTMGNTTYTVDIVLSGPKGSITLHPDLIVDEGLLSVTLPANLPAGSYDVQASKASFLSNPLVISVLPQVKIATVKYSRSGTSYRDSGAVTITGTGFAGYAQGSGTAVTAVVRGKAATATVVSWTDTKIVAKVGAMPSKVTVKSVFGKATKGL